MFGFSLQKLLVLIIIIGAVWYGFKLVGRLDAVRKAEAASHGGASRRKRPFAGMGGRTQTPPEVEDTQRCPTCGAFVPAHAPTPCERADCPY